MALNVVEPSNEPNAEATLRVLHVIGADCLARFGPMLRAVVRGLPGRDVVSIVMSDDQGSAADVVDGAAPVEGVAALNGWRAWRLERQLSGRFIPPPDVVHLWGTAGLGVISKWTRLARLPLIIYVTSRDDVDNVIRHGQHPNERILASCLPQQSAIARRAPAMSGAVDVLLPAIDLPDKPRPPTEGRTRAIVWTGRLDRHTGLPVLIEAISVLYRQNHDLHVALVGRGTGEQRTWAIIREHGVEGCFSLVEGSRFGELAVEAADILVVPAWQRAVAVGPLVAMASGVFVVTSRDQTAEWHIEGQTSVQFTPGSAQELAYHLTRLLERRREVVGVLETASAYVAQHHAISGRLPMLEELYRSAVESAAITGERH